MARLVAWLLPPDLAWVLTRDRTNWTLGRAQINLLQYAAHAVAEYAERWTIETCSRP